MFCAMSALGSIALGTVPTPCLVPSHLNEGKLCVNIEKFTSLISESASCRLGTNNLNAFFFFYTTHKHYLANMSCQKKHAYSGIPSSVRSKESELIRIIIAYKPKLCISYLLMQNKQLQKLV